MKLKIKIDNESGIPVYIQLGEHIRMLIRTGALKAGDLMPTTRKLAVDLGINVNTVARIYRDLQMTGHLTLKRGVGTFVSESVEKPVKKKKFKEIETKLDDLIVSCKEAGLTESELNQLISSKWRE